MNNPLTLTGISETKIAIVPDAWEMRARLTADAAAIVVVDNPFVADVAAESMRSIKSLLASIETARKAVKAPVLELSREIDDIAKNFCDDLTRESTRLSKLIGAYQAAEREKADRERREAQERERQAREEMARKVREAEAESARIAREAAMENNAKIAAANEADRKAAIEKAAADESALAAAANAKIQATVNEAAERVAAEKAVLANLRSAEPPTKLKITLQFEVMDVDALYLSRPDLCDIVPSKSRINAALKTTKIIPGLRVWEEAKAI